jgi:chromosome segregation ATPase
MRSAMAEISLELFNRRFEQLNEMHRELRDDWRKNTDALIAVSRQISNLDRRIGDVDRRLTDVKDELEVIFKMELGGAVANLETRLEHFIERRISDAHQPNQLSED